MWACFIQRCLTVFADCGKLNSGSFLLIFTKPIHCPSWPLVRAELLSGRSAGPEGEKEGFRSHFCSSQTHRVTEQINISLQSAAVAQNLSILGWSGSVLSAVREHTSHDSVWNKTDQQHMHRHCQWNNLSMWKTGASCHKDTNALFSLVLNVGWRKVMMVKKKDPAAFETHRFRHVYDWHNYCF